MTATPYLRLDPAILDANLRTMRQTCDAAGIALRPHAKGHKSAWIAARQLRAGARGVAVATAPECLQLARHGIPDVLITSALAPATAALALAAAALAEVTVVAGDVEAVKILDAAATAASRRIGVLIDIDLGDRRAGARDAAEALDVAARVRASSWLQPRGVQAYVGDLQDLDDAEAVQEGHRASAARLAPIIEALAIDAWPVNWITGAGTRTWRYVAQDKGPFTEVQPGSFAVMDATYARHDDVTFAPALTVVTSVISVRDAATVIVDAGHRAVSIDTGAPEVLGIEAAWESAGDQHGRVTGEVSHLRSGDHLALIPSHSDTTIPLHHGLWVDGVRVPVLRDVPA